ncbi:cupin domain-containing protein [Rhizobium sp. MC63]|uniref:Cupin domain-containing protein n=1 Tax=Rhizobium mulingense TaxID=3031128 RepID=A0ACC6MVU7_9HYPH|nr:MULTISPECIES: cupin domain-containing protein [unclassified Rhizobium]MDF0695182.1 cupin domain-containing protein [Rhizobium sp. MC63]MEA3517454.1 cupin domain-containing protein [Rhizobium sp. MJ31]MEB3045624.1 cupin domain-containing protein [Rhizobium sp. MJ21]
MKRSINRAATALTVAILIAGPVPAHDAERESVTPKFAHALANIPGKSMRVVEVDYAPGASSLPHTHAPSAFIYAYVLSGEVESKVNDGETRRYKAGESWFEAPGAVHSISRNASDTVPARLLAVFVVDTDETKLTTPVKE